MHRSGEIGTGKALVTKMLMDWVDFLVKMVNKNKFGEGQLEMKKVLISRSQEVLDCILDKLSYDKFIEMLKEGTREMLDNKYLIERTMHHFRELQRMLKSSLDVNSDDWLSYNQRLEDDLLEGSKVRFKQAEDPEFVMYFKGCRHFSSAVRRTREGEIVLCQNCEEHDEHARVRHFFERFRLNKEVLPTSDQFIPKVAYGLTSENRTGEFRYSHHTADGRDQGEGFQEEGGSV